MRHPAAAHPAIGSGNHILAANTICEVDQPACLPVGEDVDAGGLLPCDHFADRVLQHRDIDVIGYVCPARLALFKAAKLQAVGDKRPAWETRILLWLRFILFSLKPWRGVVAEDQVCGFFGDHHARRVVLPPITRGITEASTTRRQCIPRTRN
jgi:hypothetical protein